MEFLVEVLVAVLTGLVTSQLYDGSTTGARFLIKVASGRLPSGKRDRYREEWLGHLDDCEGKLAKLYHGLGCFLASHRMHSPVARYLGTTWSYLVLLSMEIALGGLVKLMWHASNLDATSDPKALEQYRDMFLDVALIHGIRKTLFHVLKSSLKDDG